MTKPIPNPLEALEALETSLQMEFEYELNGYNPRQDVLTAKKRQLELIRSMYTTTLTINLARRADKPMGMLPKGFRSTIPSVKEMIEGIWPGENTMRHR